MSVQTGKSLSATTTSQRGVVLTEFVLLLPVLLIIMMGLYDLGRVIYTHQVMTDVTREAANLVSRGSSINQAYFAAGADVGPIDIEKHGGMIFTTVQRRSTDDATPWVFDQQRKGPRGIVASRIGKPGGKAEIPNLDAIAPGVTLMVVELVHGFEPIFASEDFGFDFYPENLYDVAFF